MNEAQRQSYLRALGLTPWVARVPLPGAAPSEALDWEAETDHRPTPMADAVPASAVPRPARQESAPAEVAEAPSAFRTALEEPSASGAPSAGKEPSAERQAPSTTNPEPASRDRETAPAKPAAAAGGALVFTLEVHLAGDTWVAFQQEDAQAPELGRHTGALATALLAVFRGTPERPRRFYCPLAGQPTAAAEAGQALRAFVEGLAGRYGGERVLLCLDEPLAEALFGTARYQGFRLGERPALVVSSLEEMLADPVRHKSASWRAMRGEGFGGAGQQ
ncbi:hypothetical protein ACLD0W_08255 [Alloalcanivorax sp. C16-1]|uniref:hypothetical protein n=1 Tax=Alloalcanivorax sp. C16-1 TaxID=3390051 RepID=UPI0039707DEC